MKTVNLYIGKLSFVLIFSFLTGYIYLNARNDWYADIFLFILLFLSITTIMSGADKLKLSDFRPIWFFWVYLGIAISSFIFPPSKYLHLKWFISSFLRIGIASVIVFAIFNRIHQEKGLVRWLIPTLCLIISVVAYLVHYDVFSKADFSSLTLWPTFVGDWNYKAFGFFYVFLAWSTVAVMWGRSRLETALSCFLFISSIYLLFQFNSESAQLAAIVGLIVFILSHIPIRRGKYWVYLIVFLLFIVIPVVWVLFGPFVSREPMEVFNDNSSFLKRYWSLGERVFIYEFCTGLVRENPFLGWGFGSTLSIPLAKGAVPLWVSFPGKHPHNLPLLFMIDHGFFGFLFLTASTIYLFDYIYSKVEGRKEAPAIWALCISGQVIFSLSFSIWHPDVVLIYCAFFLFLLAALSRSNIIETSMVRQKTTYFIHSVVLISFISHLIAEHFC